MPLQLRAGLRCAGRSRLVFATRSQYEVHICTSKACKKQGSAQVVQFGKDLGLSNVTVSETGCLGRCGTGPNGMVYPAQTPIRGVSSPAALTEALAFFCDTTVPPHILKATQLRLAGNSCAREGELAEAIQLYTQGLEVLQAAGCTTGPHLLLSNRSIAHLTRGQHEAALADAIAAVAAAPEGWHTAWVRLIDAYFAMGRLAEAAAAVKQAAQASQGFKSSDEYKIITSALRSRGVQVAA